MATYYDINGQKVQNLATDPSPVQEGQVWYNTTSNTAKVRGISSTGVFSTAANMNSEHDGSGAAGITTAALCFGSTAPPTGNDKSESYDGTSWTNTNEMTGFGEYNSGLGTQTAAVAAGDGRPVGANASSLWYGTCWAAGNPTTQYGYAGVGLGIQTAGMLASRYDGGGAGPENYVELFDGTCWSNSANDLNTAGYTAEGTGIQTAAIIIGGVGRGNATEEYNGGAWTTVNSTNSPQNNGNASGTQASAVVFAGNAGICELWDGTCWATNPGSMITARTNVNNTIRAGPAGTSSTSLALGGGPNATTRITVEEYSGPGSVSTKTITTS